MWQRNDVSNQQLIKTGDLPTATQMSLEADPSSLQPSGGTALSGILIVAL